MSENTARDVQGCFGVDPLRVSVINPGITALPQPGGERRLTDIGITAPFVLCVGTLEPRKNHLRLIEAFGRVCGASASPLQLVIAGGQGWGRLDLPRAVSAAGLEERVRLLGFVDDSLLDALCALPVRRHAVAVRGLRHALDQAFGHGLVLAAGNSSKPEVVGDGGLLVDLLDTASMADGLRALLDDQTRAVFAARASKRQPCTTGITAQCAGRNFGGWQGTAPDAGSARVQNQQPGQLWRW